jgi:hypothetical protein
VRIRTLVLSARQFSSDTRVLWFLKRRRTFDLWWRPLTSPQDPNNLNSARTVDCLQNGLCFAFENLLPHRQFHIYLCIHQQFTVDHAPSALLTPPHHNSTPRFHQASRQSGFLDSVRWLAESVPRRRRHDGHRRRIRAPRGWSR